MFRRGRGEKVQASTAAAANFNPTTRGGAMEESAAANVISTPVYLDYNATTPHDPEVIAAMRPFLEKHFGNPSSMHAAGLIARQAVETARNQVAALLNCRPDEVVFTSGGTESNNYAIKGIAFSRRLFGNHIITSRIEHPAVIEVCKFLAGQGFEITWLPVDESGRLRLADVEQAIGPRTILITIMHANNEVGTIQPIEQISGLARSRRIIVHTDAAQSAGKIPTDVKELGVDLLSIAGHKLYAPKGVGVLYIRAGVQLAKFMHGAGQEKGRRAGTENVLEIVGLGMACELARRWLPKSMVHQEEMRQRLYNGLRANWPDLHLNGHPEKRLPNTLSLAFKGLDANRLLTEIKDGVAASAGAACHAGAVEISGVLKAMQVPVELARGTIRFSTGRMTTAAEIDKAVQIITAGVARLTAPPETSVLNS